MKTRVIYGIVLAVVIITLTIVGDTAMKLALLIISLIGLQEFYKAVKGNNQLDFIGYGATVLYYALFTTGINNFYMILNTGLLLILLAFMVIKHPKFTIDEIACTFLGFIYIPVLFSTVYLIRVSEYGFYLVWLTFITAFFTDIMAYFTGVRFGKRKLAPVLSPNKTVEGSIGGIVGTTVASLLYGLVLSFLINDLGGVNPFIFSITVGFFCSIFAQFGDLAASSIKRSKNIKDYGNLIPGHGGIVDRFDSIFFTSTTIYIVMEFFNLI
ncbi:MAG: phosphatidate cytidylyltransferase [Lachnospirales bacterium]